MKIPTAIKQLDLRTETKKQQAVYDAMWKLAQAPTG